MMPTCQYGRCSRVSEIDIGKLNVKDEEIISGHWDTTVYLCKKHADRLAKKLHIEFYEGGEDVQV